MQSVEVETKTPELSAAARRRGLIVVLVDTFLMWGGFFMVIPLISVHYVDALGWTAASVGLVLAVRQFTQQGMTPLSGVLADRIGAKGLICAGMFLRALGFAVMAWATTYPLLMASAVLAAVGGGFFESPKYAATAALTDEHNRGRFYSLVGVLGGLGVTAGTQLGALLLRADFALVALAAAGCFGLGGLITLLFLPNVRVATESRGLTYGLGLALRDRPFMTYSVLLTGYWFLWVQFLISMPLAATAIGGPRTVGWVYAINSGMTVLLGYPLLRLAERRLRPLPILVLGVALMGLGYGSVALVGSVGPLLLSAVLISAGVLLAFPSQQTVTANLANPASLGSYFGVNALALAVGGGLGNLSGGLLYDLGRRLDLPFLPWTVFCAVGLATAAGLALMEARSVKPRTRELPAEPTS